MPFPAGANKPGQTATAPRRALLGVSRENRPALHGEPWHGMAWRGRAWHRTAVIDRAPSRSPCRCRAAAAACFSASSRLSGPGGQGSSLVGVAFVRRRRRRRRLAMRCNRLAGLSRPPARLPRLDAQDPGRSRSLVMHAIVPRPWQLSMGPFLCKWQRLLLLHPWLPSPELPLVQRPFGNL